jgi:serine/threonine protein kinase
MPKSKQKEFVTTFSRFRSTRLIGEGGSGYVFEVRDDKEQRYALKILKKHGITTEKRKRFKNEIAFCQRDSHPNIVAIIDHGVLIEDDVAIPFYVMPYYDSSLRKHIDAGISPATAIRLFGQILDGVEAAHLQGLVHRDIKPENILLTEATNQLVIADFGIARFLQDELYTAVETKSAERLANFQYAAPEQRARGALIGSRADIFAVGLILNEMFTSEIPQGTDYKTISSVEPAFRYLDEAVGKMIRQSPENRLGSIAEVKRLLTVLGADFASQQKLSKLQREVIAATDVDDPLVIHPVEIIDIEWDKGQLTLILSQPINQKWIAALNNMGSFSNLSGYPPSRFQLKGNRAVIPAEERVIQQLIDHFKGWIPKTTRRYEQILRDEIAQEEAQRLERARKVREEEESKARLRQNIKL